MFLNLVAIYFQWVDPKKELCSIKMLLNLGWKCYVKAYLTRTVSREWHANCTDEEVFQNAYKMADKEKT